MCLRSPEFSCGFTEMSWCASMVSCGSPLLIVLSCCLCYCIVWLYCEFHRGALCFVYGTVILCASCDFPWCIYGILWFSCEFTDIPHGCYIASCGCPMIVIWFRIVCWYMVPGEQVIACGWSMVSRVNDSSYGFLLCLYFLIRWSYYVPRSCGYPALCVQFPLVYLWYPVGFMCCACVFLMCCVPCCRVRKWFHVSSCVYVILWFACDVESRIFSLSMVSSGSHLCVMRNRVDVMVSCGYPMVVLCFLILCYYGLVWLS